MTHTYEELKPLLELILQKVERIEKNLDKLTNTPSEPSPSIQDVRKVTAKNTNISKDIEIKETSYTPAKFTTPDLIIGEWVHTFTFSYFISENLAPIIQNLSYDGFSTLEKLLDFFIRPYELANKKTNAFDRFLLLNMPWKYPINSENFFSPDDEEFKIYFVSTSGKYLYYWNGYCVDNIVNSPTSDTLACLLDGPDLSPLLRNPSYNTFEGSVYLNSVYVLLTRCNALNTPLIKKDKLAERYDLLSIQGDYEKDICDLILSPKFQKSLLKFCLIDPKNTLQEARLMGFPGIYFVEKDNKIGFSNAILTEKYFKFVSQFNYPLSYTLNHLEQPGIFYLFQKTLWNLQNTIVCPYYHDERPVRWIKLLTDMQINPYERRKLGCPSSTSKLPPTPVKALLKQGKTNLKTKGVYMTFEEKRNKSLVLEDIHLKLPLPIGDWEIISDFVTNP